MAYKKKITGEQFIEDIINFELKPYGVNYDYVNSEYNTDVNDGVHENWYNKYVFHNYSEFFEWKKYFFEHYKDWRPMRDWRRTVVEREFNFCNFMWGLSYDFDWKTLEDCKSCSPDVYDLVFNKKK